MTAALFLCEQQMNCVKYLIMRSILLQFLGTWFYYWHPSSSSELPTSNKCVMKYSCFFGKWSRTPEEFANAAAFYLGGPVKLVVVPSIVIAVIEVTSLTTLQFITSVQRCPPPSPYSDILPRNR